jgi:hypothetical protein
LAKPLLERLPQVQCSVALLIIPDRSRTGHGTIDHHHVARVEDTAAGFHFGDIGGDLAVLKDQRAGVSDTSTTGVGRFPATVLVVMVKVPSFPIAP